MVMERDNIIYYKSAHGQTLKLTFAWDGGIGEYITAFKSILTFATFSEDTIEDVFREDM